MAARISNISYNSLNGNKIAISPNYLKACAANMMNPYFKSIWLSEHIEMIRKLANIKE